MYLNLIKITERRAVSAVLFYLFYYYRY